MTNRQARREQRRGARRESGSGTRSRPTGGGGGRPNAPQPPSGGGGLPGWLTQPFTIGVVVLVVVLGAVLIAFIALGGSDGADTNEVEALESADIPLDLADGTALGSPDAPLTIVAYEDFQCPFCLEYTANSEPALYDYIRNGDVRYEYHYYPILGEESPVAAMAAQCAADQDLFWPYAHELYLEQAREGQLGNEELNVGRFDIDNLKELASNVGVDRTIFDPCLDSFQYQELVDESVAAAQGLGLTSTPSFTVNGDPLPPTSIPATGEGWVTLVDGLLAQINGEAPPTATDGEDGEDASATADAGDEETPAGEEEASATEGE